MNIFQKCEVLESLAVYSVIRSKDIFAVSSNIIHIGSVISLRYVLYLLIFIFPIVFCIFNICLHPTPLTFVRCISISILALHCCPPVLDLTIRTIKSVSGFIKFRPQFQGAPDRHQLPSEGPFLITRRHASNYHSAIHCTVRQCA
jgi:hypothetical protein